MDDRSDSEKNGKKEKKQKKHIRECEQAKERWLNEKSGKVEMLSTVDKTLMCSGVKELTGGPRNKSGTALKKRDGELVARI